MRPGLPRYARKDGRLESSLKKISLTAGLAQHALTGHFKLFDFDTGLQFLNHRF